MIQKLRFRLIRLAVLFQLILLIVIILFSNYASYLKLADNADTVIDELWKEPWADYSPQETPSPSPSPESSAAEASESFLEETPETSESAQEDLLPSETAPTPSLYLPPKAGHGPSEREAWMAWAMSAQDWTQEDFAAWQEWWKQANQNGPRKGPPNASQWESSYEGWDSIGSGEWSSADSEEGSWDDEAFDSSLEDAPPTAAASQAPMPTSDHFYDDPRTQRPSEVPFESRYFIVTESTDGELLSLNMDHIISISPVEALTIVQEIKQAGESRGFQGDLRYGVRQTGDVISYLFLDCRRDLDTFRNSLIANCLISLLGLLAVFGLMVVFSGRMVKPVAESYEKQKRFISAAGHELRTPITIISADAELLGMEVGENEWLQDIVTQSGRMSELTNSLLTLSRMDEGREPMQMIEFPVSDIVEETAASFEVLAQASGKTIEMDIEPMRSMVGAEKSIRQLVSILMDNAVKYSTGTISVSLKQQGGETCIMVENSAEPVSEAQLSQFFDRFYRTENSRNSETGGYGLGLAIAKSIVDSHKGNITASAPQEGTVRITAVFPI